MKLNTAVLLFMTRKTRREENLFTFSFIPSFFFSPRSVFRRRIIGLNGNTWKELNMLLLPLRHHADQ